MFCFIFSSRCWFFCLFVFYTVPEIHYYLSFALSGEPWRKISHVWPIWHIKTIFPGGFLGKNPSFPLRWPSFLPHPGHGLVTGPQELTYFLILKNRSLASPRSRGSSFVSFASLVLFSHAQDPAHPLRAAALNPRYRVTCLMVSFWLQGLRQGWGF